MLTKKHSKKQNYFYVCHENTGILKFRFSKYLRKFSHDFLNATKNEPKKQNLTEKQATTGIKNGGK